MNRLYQCLLIASLLPLSWLGMLAVHEFGHAIGAWLTGGTVTRVVLHPLVISRTDVSPNPHPLIVVWMGPLLGCLLPLAAFGLAQAVRLPGAYLLRFFAVFCLIANGAYIGVGSFDRVGDAGAMQRHGSAAWQLWLFGAVAVPCGLLLWHHLGSRFGLGQGAGRVSRRAARGCLLALAVLVVVELAASGLALPD